jgi:hypothetical protein
MEIVKYSATEFSFNMKFEIFAVVIQVMAVLYLFWLGKLIPGERG